MEAIFCLALYIMYGIQMIKELKHVDQKTRPPIQEDRPKTCPTDNNDKAGPKAKTVLHISNSGNFTLLQFLNYDMVPFVVNCALYLFLFFEQ